ncbi:MAG TPA: YggS family pyridoxal phosphate-dependent enzyme [Bryobacteraceae bacterium]|nr:YggS family pyridoxal phosphate-dependent enzyme [Bryobacteraceae bacterium]
MALAERWNEVRERIERAAQRAGRRADEVTLLAVTKVFPVEVLLEAYSLGMREFGENYVQEFEKKYPHIKPCEEARFHLIGHLQSNKARKAAEMFQVVQTVDSPKLARRLGEAGRPLEVMIEVKLSQEESKHGVAPEDLGELVDAIREEPMLHLTGLMTMPPWSDDPETARPYFRQLRGLADSFGLASLSMGMSHDLEVAIEEGSTMVRVGTALFGSRKALL